MKTAIMLIADLVRSLVLSGLSAVAWLALGGVLVPLGLVGLWRIVRRRHPRS